MANIKPTALVADISGSVHTETYARNRGGIYVRARTPPDQTPSPARTLAQAAMTACSQAWSATLTEVQRLSWRKYSAQHPRPNRWGIPHDIGGKNEFVRTNFIPWLEDEEINKETAPADPPPHAPDFEISTSADDTVDVDLPPTNFDPPPTNLEVYAFIGHDVSAGTNYYQGPWRYRGSNRWNGAAWIDGDPWELSTLEALTNGHKISLRLVAKLASGAMSNPNIATCIIDY